MTNLNNRLINYTRNGNIENIVDIINQGANINFQNPNGITPLMFAAMNGNIEIVQFFIQIGVDLNIQNHRYYNNLV